MIAVLTILEIYRNREQAWHEVWQRVDLAQRKAEGFHAGRLLRDADKPGRYVILTEWDDRSRYDSFIRHIGVTWLNDAWEFSPGPATVLFLHEES